MALEMRRSSRVAYSLPISISGVDPQGRPFYEHVSTAEVSGHGALILCRRSLTPGAELEIAAHLGVAPRRARVVRITGTNGETGALKVATEFSPPGNFWKLDSPPPDWEPPAGSSRAPVQAGPAERPAALPQRALILDDDPGLAALVEAALLNEGWSVTVLHDPMKLEAAIASTAYGVVISDLQMPGRSGLEVLRILRESHPGLARRFILITGAPFDVERAGADLVGVPVLYKPFSLAKLAEAVKKMQQKQS